MKTETVDAILIYVIDTGTGMVSGRVGLKFLLKIPQRHTIDLCEHVVSWSKREYPAATTTPDAFHDTAAIYILSYTASWF